MTTRRYELEVYWDGGDEPVVAAAAKIASLLDVMKETVPDTREWYLADGTGRERLDHEDPVSDICRVLEGAVETWNYGPWAFRANTLFATNALPRIKSVRVAIKCRTSPKSDVGIWFANYARVSVWGPRAGFSDPAALVSLFDATCRIFVPAWGVAGPPDWPARRAEDAYFGVPKVSALTYLAPEYPVPPAGTAQVEIIEQTGGHRLTAVSDWCDPSNPDHVARIEATRDELASVGALRPRTAPVPD